MSLVNGFRQTVTISPGEDTATTEAVLEITRRYAQDLCDLLGLTLQIEASSGPDGESRTFSGVPRV